MNDKERFKKYNSILPEEVVAEIVDYTVLSGGIKRSYHEVLLEYDIFADTKLGKFINEDIQQLHDGFVQSISKLLVFLAKYSELHTKTTKKEIKFPQAMNPEAHKLLDNFYDSYIEYISGVTSMLFNENNRTSKITYDSFSGSGTNGLVTFKFKDHQPEYRVFAVLYKNIGKPMLKKDVLNELKKNEDSKDASDAISKLAIKIRDRAGLTTSELVLNNGNLTLVLK